MLDQLWDGVEALSIHTIHVLVTRIENSQVRTG